MIFALISSASCFQSARVSFSLGSRVISMALALLRLQHPAVGQLRDRDREELEGQVHHGHQVRDDQDDVLRHLGPGDRAHAAQHRAEEHAEQADEDADVEVQADEARHDEPDARHLGDEVGEGAGDGGDHAHDARRVAAVAGAQEVRDRVGAELAEVGAEEHGEQQVAARPPHDVGQAREALGRERAAHRDERRRRHPVRAGGHAVVEGRHAAAGHVVLVRVRGAGDDADDDVDQQRQRHEEPADPPVREAEGASRRCR